MARSFVARTPVARVAADRHVSGLFIYAFVLATALFVAPDEIYDASSTYFILVIGSIGAWRYGWAMVHLTRAIIYKDFVFPRWRRRAEELGDAGRPTHIYLIVTSFRIDTETTRLVYRSVIDEAIAYGANATIICSIVEMADQRLVKHLFAAADPPDRVRLEFVRIAGTGKRDGLANAFRSVAASRPPPDAVACVIDGDTILTPGLLRGCMPLFKLFPKALALTTDEVCDVIGARVFREWYSMRFAQRQVLMCSVGLSRHVLTLTGRMSAFRASVLTDPEFIARVEEDYIDHWRFGRLKFLTGDDKSSWYDILARGGEMLYVPDVKIKTVEVPPMPSFVGSATVLMIRWFGNMLRTNGRAIALGPRRMGLFTWWCVVDQRVSMWTSLVGPVTAITLAFAADPFILPLYILWVALTRFLQTLILLTMRSEVSAYYPFLLYFNQIYGSMVKVFVLFRLDRQKWTRQNTVGGLGLSGLRNLWKGASTLYLNTVAVALFVVLVSLVVGALPTLSVGELGSFVSP